MLEKSHKKLHVWQRAIDLVQHVYEFSAAFPAQELYGLTSQMRRAAVSVPANISEGAARQTKKEFIQFLHMAQGSLSELDTHLEIVSRLNYSSDQSIDELSLMVIEVDKMLSGLIKSLKP